MKPEQKAKLIKRLKTACKAWKARTKCTDLIVYGDGNVGMYLDLPRDREHTSINVLDLEKLIKELEGMPDTGVSASA